MSHHERVVVTGLRFLDSAVDLERVGLVVVVETLDLALLERDELDLGALFLDGLPRLGQFDLLDHVGGEERHALALQLVRHREPLLLGLGLTARAEALPRRTRCGAVCTAGSSAAGRPERRPRRRTTHPRSRRPTSCARARSTMRTRRI